MVSKSLPVANMNMFIEVVAGGVSRCQPYYSNELAVQLIENYGQLKVCERKSGKALPGTYVKVYAAMNGGGNEFYKDGYTDLRGKFDYVSLSSDTLTRVSEFSILVLHDKLGAVVKKAKKPT